MEYQRNKWGSFICLVVNVIVSVIKICLCVYWILSIVVSHLQYIYNKLLNCVLPKKY